MITDIPVERSRSIVVTREKKIRLAKESTSRRLRHSVQYSEASSRTRALPQQDRPFAKNGDTILHPLATPGRTPPTSLDLSHCTARMTSAQISTLRHPPNVNDSASRALAYVNETYKSLDDLDGSPDLEALVEQARQRVEELDTKVRLDR